MGLLILLHVVTFFAIKVAAQTNEQCPDLFKRYSSSHTYCKPPNSKCNILRSSVSAEDIQIILREHNKYRSKIATGKEKGFPTATNMMQLVWDDELAAVAQKFASQCDFQHDCADCRRVPNFGVGENLAWERTSGSQNTNWEKAIYLWYNEQKYFSKNFIEKYQGSKGPHNPGHFSQLAWADSWRIGCGYVLYKKNNNFEKLYVCNYGPGGNTVSLSMYKIGPPCSGCPENSKCEASTGLCKMNGDVAPKYKSEENYIFNCDFNNQTECEAYVTGENKWLKYKTLSGNYIGIVLSGGKTSTLILKNKIKPSTNTFCISTKYRKGPNVKGQADDNKVTVNIKNSKGFATNVNLPNYGGSLQFAKFKMSLGWKLETQVKITFSVPAGRPEQFFEIAEIHAKSNKC